MKTSRLWIMVLLGIFVSNMAVAETKWIDVAKSDRLTVDGLPWYKENGNKFLRLPLKDQEKIPPKVWWMSKCPSGARVRFKTDSTSLKLRINHAMSSKENLSMWHMSSVAVSGIDLYIGPPGEMNFWKTTNPQEASIEYEHIYFENMPKTQREFTLYLPAYAELADLKIGIDEDTALQMPTQYSMAKPIVYYGTSITQGACAGRGGNGFVPRVGRMLNCDFVNLGFSGSGCGEQVMAEIMSQVDASIYVVDSLANMNTSVMQERYETFVRTLRKNRPQTPIVLMTKIHFADEIQKAQADEYDRQHKPLFQTYEKMKSKGDKNIYLFDAGKVIPAGYNHPTVDGIHLTDSGFQTIANELTPFLKKILQQANETCRECCMKESKVYSVKRISNPFEIDGDWNKWDSIEPAVLGCYMGQKPDHFPYTQVKLCYDDNNIYVIFRVEDQYVKAVERGYQVPVYQDSCVEFFFTPNDDISDGYFNFEMNCVGAMLVRHQKLREVDTVSLTQSDLEKIEVAHSIPSMMSKEIEGPVLWTLEYKIPISIVEKYAPVKKPASGVTWKANFYKCGDNTSHPHWLTWSYIDKPAPDFHRPEYFGVLTFD